jgi:hypothetical protein
MFPSNANRSFTPDDLAVLYKAFDECCEAAVGEFSIARTPAEKHVLKMQIARVLMLAYASGVHDPKAMKQIALQVAV